MNTTHRLLIAAAIFGLSTSALGLALAKDPAAPAELPPTEAAPPAPGMEIGRGGPQWLEKDELIRRIEAQGYTKPRKFEREKGRLEVKALDATGNRVELDVDPVSGKVLRAEKDD